MRKVPEGQGAFDFDAPPPEPQKRTWGWDWHDPWPLGLTDEEAFTRQVARDMRALEEAKAKGPGMDDEAPFFRARIEMFREAAKKAVGGQ